MIRMNGSVDHLDKLLGDVTEDLPNAMGYDSCKISTIDSFSYLRPTTHSLALWRLTVYKRINNSEDNESFVI